MIPTSSNFPEEFDDNGNLFEVRDGLRLRLSEDYIPGDSTIQTEGNIFIIAAIPETGLITLTEQCSDLDKRALSFYYGSFDDETGIFSDLDKLEEFEDVEKPKRITNVTVNVMARHHNHIKNAVINIQEFCGVQGTTDLEPFGETLEGRINFLRNLVLVPKSWFTSDKRTGNIPLEIEFKDMSFRLGTDGNAGDVKLTWDFGDQSHSTISLYSLVIATDEAPGVNPDILVRDEDGGTITKTYLQPGLYDVKLTVENDFGSNVCVFPEFINARIKSPDDAFIQYVVDLTTQDGELGVPPQGPFNTPPKIRSPINTLIEIEIPQGENPSNPGRSYAGEILDGVGSPIDAITNYTWALGDDLTHPNNYTTKASYSVGGIYDLKLRVDTEYGAYRITTYENAIDIIENQNLWMWIYSSPGVVRSYEYGLISESFKLVSTDTLNVTRDASFIEALTIENPGAMRKEFIRNTGFAPKGTQGSGTKSSAFLYWASGRGASDPVSSEEIKTMEYVGFEDRYIPRPAITRPWNWANFNSSTRSYFIFGTVDSYPTNTSPTNITKQAFDFSSMTVTSEDLSSENYLNGANELEQNVALYDNVGEATYGHYSVQRTAWKDNSGYMLRNDAVGPFLRIKNFYRTEGTLGSNFINIRKLQDVQGPTKLEGELTDMSTGIFFLNNSGAVSMFNPEESVWRSGGPGVNSLLYRNLQDAEVAGFDDQANTMLLASDGDKRAYISFDYSPNTFLKFNEIDLTFSTLGSRPDGDQWIMGVF